MKSPSEKLADELFTKDEIEGRCLNLSLGSTHLKTWRKGEIFSRLQKFEREVRAEAAKAICGLCGDESYTAATLEDGFYWHRYADVPNGGNVRRSCAADKIHKVESNHEQ